MACGVLQIPGMKNGLLVATGLAAAVLAIAPQTAAADGYLGLALGSEPGVNDNLRRYAQPLGRSLRGLAGIRFGNVSIEGALNGFDVVAANTLDRTIYQLSGALKLSIPLGNNFEAFGRAGLERTWLNFDDPNLDLTGDGFLVGAGFEYRLNAILANASLFIDYTVHRTTLESMRNDKVDSTLRIWGLGFTVGI
jgi:hypothetical protein